MPRLTRSDFKPWIIAALRAHGGSASIAQVCKHIWEHNHALIVQDEALLYTGQFEVRWAKDLLSRDGILLPAKQSGKGRWQLSHP